ncbi:MAG: hypothetical protein VX874_01900 [Pseudomonadota bacterium]|nr:hypothetical protein [Pseudomonadota bacterium]
MRALTRTASIAAFATVILSGTPALAQDVDINKIFDCSEGGPLGAQTPAQCEDARMVLLNNCTSCHTFVPIVKAQKSEEAWDSQISIHQERVKLDEDEWQLLNDFLKSHFNETEPVPELPPALEALGSNQPA